jgi:hypothetical protein
MVDNPTEAVKIVLQVVIPCGVAILTIWVNIKVKFARDAAHAISEVKGIFAWVLVWIANALIAGNLIWEFLQPSANARLNLAFILFNSFALFNSYMMWLILRLLKIMRKQAEATARLVDIVTSAELLERIQWEPDEPK